MPTVRVTTLLRLPVGVSRAVAVAQAGHVVVLGGLAPGDTTTGRVWVIDTARRVATAAGRLTTAVHDASGALLDGRPVVFGGGAATGVASVQAWAGGRSSVIGQLPTPRSDSAAAVIGATAYVVGGFTGASMARDVLATTDGRTFRTVARLPIGVRYPGVAAVGGKVYVIGGELATTEGTLRGGQTDAIQQVDPATGHVKVVAHLAHPLGHTTAFVLGHRVYVAGGRHGSAATSVVTVLDLATGRQTTVAHLPHALSDAAVAVVGTTAYLVGGETTGPSAPASSVLAVNAAR